MAVDRERGRKAVVTLASLVIVGAGVHFAAPVLEPFLVAAFIATVTAPLVLWLVGRGVPRGLAVLAGVLVDLGALAGLTALFGLSLTSLYVRLPGYQRELEATVQNLTAWLAQQGIAFSPEAMRAAGSASHWLGMGASVLSGLANVVGSIVSLLGIILLVLIIVVFLLFEATGLRAKVARALSDPVAAGHLAAASHEVNKYLLVKTATSALTGVLIGFWVALCGVDLPLLWGLLAFLLNYIPTLGSIVAAVPAILLALLEEGPATGLALTIGYLVINVAIGFLEPRILGRALGMSPLVVFLSVVAWGWLLGPVGALLSVPLTMMVKIVLQDTDDLRWVAVLLEPVHPTTRDTVPPQPPPDVRQVRKVDDAPSGTAAS